MKINLRTKYLVSEVLLFTLLWMVVIMMYFHIAIWGMQNFMESEDYWKLFQAHYSIGDLMLHGFAFGFMFSVINVIFDRTRFRRFSIGKIVILKTIFYLIANTLADTLIILINIGFEPEFFMQGLRLHEIHKEIPAGFMIGTLFYYIFFILLFNLLYQISKKIGPGILLSSIFGKYHQPRDEKLVFMFLDLKNSTAIAERLEHKKYSLFIKDCFAFLTNPIYNCEADVYQYVGDEAVLIWPLHKGIRNLNCIRLFYEYKRVL
ncbi:MAG: hypothetical protein ACOCX8_04060, partial [Bacteroidota bacterium]